MRIKKEKTMKKKAYMTPTTRVHVCKTKQILMQSQFDPEKDNQDITPTDDPWDGEFNGRRYGWGDEDDE